MATIPNQASLDIASLVNLFTSKSGSQTQSSNISKEGMDTLVRQILESDRGIASIVGGQNRAGLYNTTTNQQLVGDFVARTAGELEARRAGTTTTNRTNPTIDPTRAAIGLGAASLLGPTISRGLESVGVSGGIGGVGRSIADLIFGSAGGTSVLPGTVDMMTTEDPEFTPVDVPTDLFPEEDYSWLFAEDDGGDIWGD